MFLKLQWGSKDRVKGTARLIPMPQESPRYLAVVRNGEIECARGTRGPREIADPLRL